ncbi:MAG: histidine phosphatase family protein [Peptoniphilaceae bacterium]|nr:histidine phosphatase family protein [Peptoniphilaceae bacterium]MDY6019511.1 histidine phosphatase family protein [Anaerococcus sp.]
MRIWLTRHGQTDLNKKKYMQGLIDSLLNEKGLEQAKSARASIGDIKFDAVYASPLERAIKTAEIIGNVERDKIIIDQRLIEVDFGKYDNRYFASLGLKMSLYWLYPEIIKTPKTVETLQSMIDRASSFLKDIEKKDYEDVLIVCHGGIIRALCGYLEDRPNGIKWRPKPKNCEIRIYESNNGKHKFIKSLNK